MAAFGYGWASVAALLLLWHGTTVAEARPSFDCGAASQPIDRLICSDNGLKARDAAMASAFAAARARAAGLAERAALLAEQRDWLAGRARACPAASAAPIALKEGYRDAAIDCLAGLYEQRIAVLEYDRNQSEWSHLPFRPSLVEGAGQKLCEDLRRDLDISFLGPGLFVNPLGEREIGFVAVTLPETGADAETQFTLQRAEFDLYNRGRSLLVLQGIFDNGGLRLPTVRYWQLPSAAALAALLHQQYWDVDVDALGRPVIDTEAFPRGTTTEPRPSVVDGATLSVDQSPHYFRYGGRVYLLARLQSAPGSVPDAGVYELAGPTELKRRCLFRTHFPMANSVYDDAVIHDVDARAETVAGDIGPLLPAGKICVAAGDRPRTLWDDEAYRPWLLERRGWWSVGGIDPPAFARYLHNRSLTGLEQNRAYRKYVAARETAIAENAGFFAKRFARSADAARHLAALAIDWRHIDGSMIGLKDAATVTLLDDDFERQHALQAAVFAGDEAKVSALLDADPKVAAARAKGPLDEPLVSDALEHPDLLRSLLSKGLDPNETGVSGRTPLMTAARLDLIEATRILLERGAEVNAGAGAAVANIYPDSDDVTCQMMGEAPVSSDTPGRTALSYAAELASPEMARLLLAHGADPRQSDASGEKPVDHVPANGQDRSATIRELLK